MLLQIYHHLPSDDDDHPYRQRSFASSTNAVSQTGKQQFQQTIKIPLEFREDLEMRSWLELDESDLQNHACFYKCTVNNCAYVSTSHVKFNKHLMHVHADLAMSTQGVACSYCMKSISNNGSIAHQQQQHPLIKHLHEAHSKLIYQCSLCAYRGQSYAHVYGHAYTEHMRRQFGEILSAAFIIECKPPLNSIQDNVIRSDKDDLAEKYEQYVERIRAIPKRVLSSFNCPHCSAGNDELVEAYRHQVLNHKDLPLCIIQLIDEHKPNNDGGNDVQPSNNVDIGSLLLNDLEGNVRDNDRQANQSDILFALSHYSDVNNSTYMNADHKKDDKKPVNQATDLSINGKKHHEIQQSSKNFDERMQKRLFVLESLCIDKPTSMPEVAHSVANSLIFTPTTNSPPSLSSASTTCQSNFANKSSNIQDSNTLQQSTSLTPRRDMWQQAPSQCNSAGSVNTHSPAASCSYINSARRLLIQDMGANFNLSKAANQRYDPLRGSQPPKFRSSSDRLPTDDQHRRAIKRKQPCSGSEESTIENNQSEFAKGKLSQATVGQASVSQPLPSLKHPPLHSSLIEKEKASKANISTKARKNALNLAKHEQQKHLSITQVNRQSSASHHFCLFCERTGDLLQMKQHIIQEHILCYSCAICDSCTRNTPEELEKHYNLHHAVSSNAGMQKTVPQSVKKEIRTVAYHAFVNRWVDTFLEKQHKLSKLKPTSTANRLANGGINCCILCQRSAEAFDCKQSKPFADMSGMQNHFYEHSCWGELAREKEMNSDSQVLPNFEKITKMLIKVRDGALTTRLV